MLRRLIVVECLERGKIVSGLWILRFLTYGGVCSN